MPAVVLVISTLLSACDIGDGTTLQAPVAPTTTAPIDTAPLPSVPLTDTVLPGDGASGDAFSVTSVPGDAGFDDGEIEPFSVVAPWTDGGPIDPRYTCDGAGEAPDVAWTGVPAGATELALSLVDESNLIEGRPFVHWVVAGIDPAVGQVVPGNLPPGAFETTNAVGDIGYSSLCPGPGTTGVYVLELFALGQQVEAGIETPAADLVDIVRALSFDVAALSGTVTR